MVLRPHPGFQNLNATKMEAGPPTSKTSNLRLSQITSEVVGGEVLHELIETLELLLRGIRVGVRLK